MTLTFSLQLFESIFATQCFLKTKTKKIEDLTVISVPFFFVPSLFFLIDTLTLSHSPFFLILKTDGCQIGSKIKITDFTVNYYNDYVFVFADSAC